MIKKNQGKSIPCARAGPAIAIWRTGNGLPVLSLTIGGAKCRICGQRIIEEPRGKFKGGGDYDID